MIIGCDHCATVDVDVQSLVPVLSQVHLDQFNLVNLLEDDFTRLNHLAIDDDSVMQAPLIGWS